jgi:ribosomal protein S14
MNKVKKDKQIRLKFNTTYPESLLSTILSKNKILSLNTRQQWLFNKHFKFSTRIRNYCLLTGRSRGVLPTWKVSRIVFKTYADFGLLPGIRTASW